MESKNCSHIHEHNGFHGGNHCVRGCEIVGGYGKIMKQYRAPAHNNCVRGCEIVGTHVNIMETAISYNLLTTTNVLVRQVKRDRTKFTGDSFNSFWTRGDPATHGMGTKKPSGRRRARRNEEAAADEQGSTWGSAAVTQRRTTAPPPTEDAVDSPQPTGG